jgi:aromatic ring-opening dioxygenase LigB subunit
LWIEEQYKDNPLEAVASTFRLHENVIPHIKEIKRQGDILLLEMNEDVKPEGNVVPLTAAQYFGLLTAQS